MKELIQLLQAKVSRNGELHLDKESTLLLIRWLNSESVFFEQQKDLIKDLSDAIMAARRRFSETEQGGT